MSRRRSLLTRFLGFVAMLFAAWRWWPVTPLGVGGVEVFVSCDAPTTDGVTIDLLCDVPPGNETATRLRHLWAPWDDRADVTESKKVSILYTTREQMGLRGREQVSDRPERIVAVFRQGNLELGRSEMPLPASERSHRVVFVTPEDARQAPPADFPSGQ